MGSRGSDYDSNGGPNGLKADDLFFVMYQNDGGHNYFAWELEDKDILVVGYDENGNAYSVDKSGNPTEKLKRDPEESLEKLGEGMSLKDAQADFEKNAENSKEEYENDPWNYIDDNEDNHTKVKW